MSIKTKKSNMCVHTMPMLESNYSIIDCSLKGIMSLSLVFLYIYIFALKFNIYLLIRSIKRVFLCAACLPLSFTMHVPISELHIFIFFKVIVYESL